MSTEPFPTMPEDAPDDLVPAPAAHGRWWRFDRRDPRIWAWTPFAEPLHRFDPLSGRFRVRYATSSLAGAVMERFGSYGRRRVTVSEGDTVVARLSGRPATVDLTDPDSRRTLDVPDAPRTLAEDRDAITALLAAGVTVPEPWLDDLDHTDPR